MQDAFQVMIVCHYVSISYIDIVSPVTLGFIWTNTSTYWYAEDFNIIIFFQAQDNSLKNLPNQIIASNVKNFLSFHN